MAFSQYSMGKEKTAEKQKAFDLFCNTELTQKEITGIVHVSQQQMSKWVTAENWDLHKTARRVTTGQLILDYYQQLAAINREIKENQHNVPTAAQTDMMNKVKDNITGLQKRYNLSAYHSVLKEFTEWIVKVNANDAKVFGPYMLDFLRHKAKQLSDDKSIG
jgi:hypothetical protein